jgi:acyl-CoA thioester hydrolase
MLSAINCIHFTTRAISNKQCFPLISRLLSGAAARENYTITGRNVVYPWNCDHMGHMNVMHYTGRFDEATWHLFSMIGVTSAYLRKDNGKFGVAALENRVNYFAELFPGDTFIIQSGILQISGKKIMFRHELWKDVDGNQVLAATSQFLAVHIDRQSHKGCPFPDDIIHAAQKHLVPQKEESK